MHNVIRIGLLSLLAVGLTSPGYGQEQTTQRPVVPGAATPASVAPTIPGGDEVLATVTSRNQTAKITKAELINLLRNFPLPALEERESRYKEAIDYLASVHLIKHYLSAQRVDVPDTNIDEQIERMKEQLKKQGQDLPTLIRQNEKSMNDLRKEIADQLRYPEFVKSKATDAELRRYLNSNRDRFGRTRIRASHILLNVPPNATKEEKDKVKQRLDAIRKQVVDNKISFAAAANKYSEDPANTGGVGGDLDYFTLDSGFVEEFADAAFKLKKGEISHPVETPFGIHLIQVTDRIEGKLPDFEQSKPYIVNAYGMDLQKEIITEERKTAKVDIKPMPKDLFPSQPAPAVAPGAPAPAPAGGGAATPKP